MNDVSRIIPSLPVNARRIGIRVGGASRSEIESVFRAWHVKVSWENENTEGPESEIAVESPDAGPLGPPKESFRRLIGDEVTWISLSRRVLYFEKLDGSSLLLIDLDAGHARISGKSPWLHLDSAFSILLGRQLGRFGIALVHAAAVGFGGRCALIFGESGRGKSTLVSQVLSINKDSYVIGDDLVLLRCTGDDKEEQGVFVAPIKKTMTIDSAMRFRAGVGGDHVHSYVDYFGRNRDQIIIDSDRIARPESWVEVTDIWIPTIWSGRESRVRKGTAGEGKLVVSSSVHGTQLFLGEEARMGLARALEKKLQMQGQEIMMGQHENSVCRVIKNVMEIG